MHPSRHLPTLLLSGCLVLLAGCASPSSPNAIMDRVDANRTVYETWPIEIKDAVLSGQVLRGMTTDMVYVARGKPNERIDRGNGDEVWVYTISSGNSASPLLPRGTSVSVGTGGSYPSTYPGAGYPGGSGTGIYVPPIVLGGGGGSSGYEPVIEDQIVFRNGRVTHGDGVK